MFDLDRWEEILNTIMRNRMRSILTAFGIAWGIFMLVVMAGAGLSVERFVGSQTRSLAMNSCFLYCGPTSVPYKGFAEGRRWSFSNDDIEAIREMDGVKYVSPILDRWGGINVTAGERSGSYRTEGVLPAYNLIFTTDIIHGRYLNDIDIAQNRKVCVLGNQVWKELFPSGEDPSGTIIKIGNLYFTVVGVNKPLNSGVNLNGDPSQKIVMPVNTLQSMLPGQGDKFDFMAISGDNTISSAELQKKVIRLMAERHSISPDDDKAIEGFNMEESFSFFTNFMWGINLLIWVVGLGTLLAGVFGVSSIMLVVVRERTQEMGIRRALGATPGNVIGQIMSESFILTFIAGVAGLTFGVGVLALAEKIIAASGGEWASPQVSFGLAMSALSVIVLGGVIAGIIPAVNAVNVRPVDAIREE